MVQVSYAVWHFQTPYSGFSVLFERRTGRYELTWSESTTLEGSGHRPKNIHVLQHWVLHMFAFMTQSSAFVCICCCICCGIFLHLLWHFFAFIVAFLCICCGISLHLLWHLFYFFLLCSTYMFANVLTQNVNAETNGSINVTNVSVDVSISVNKCINKRIKSYCVKIRSYLA